MRARAVTRHLEDLGPDGAARVLGELLGRGVEGSTVAVAAFGQALLDVEGGFAYEWKVELYASARGLGLDEVAALLLWPPPHRTWEEPRDKADPRLAHLSLGEKKTLARLRRDPDLLARLAAEGEPAVVRELLRNPLLTEDFAVRIASRRPVRPETLRCLYEERRWRTRAAVRRALARNPYVETGIALAILPMLALRDLIAIATDGALHVEVRAQARRVAAGRRGRRSG